MSFQHYLSLFAQVVAPQAPAVEIPWHQQGWFNFVLALVILVGPFLFGNFLARRLRMPDYSWRMGIVLFALIAGAVVCARGWPPRLGIDLSGGVILVYEIDPSKQGGADVATVADHVRKALAESGINAGVSATAEGKLEVTLPGLDAAETRRAEQQIERVQLGDAQASLAVESRPVREGHQMLVYDLRSAGAIDMDKMVSAIGRRVNPGGQKEVTVRRMGSDRVEVIIPQVDQAEIDVIKEKISTAGALKFRILADPQQHSNAITLAKMSDAREVRSEGEVIAEWIVLDPEEFDSPAKYPSTIVRTNKRGDVETLVINQEPDVTGAYLSAARADHDQFGRPCVEFSFNSQGAVLFGDLTSRHLPDPNGNLEYKLGIILDGRLKSAPNIRSTITSQGQITGDFSQEEVKFLVDILNAGSLPAALSKIPVAEYSSSAQLGEDTIRAGATAMAAATGLILVFMLVYYRFAGFVADLAVLLNVLLVLALMILIKAHMTLAGLAGLVLSVGMAVDANVLIYERMREELERGAALRMAIRNGFSRAMSTIVDSNLTTLIVGVVLYAIGTDQLRGFATTLILGLTLNLFTAVYCSRLVFDVAERNGWLKQLRMMKLFGKTNFDFVAWMKPAMATSLLVIVVGLGAAFVRGAGLFGIDFTGGTAIQVVFKESVPIADVRAAVAQLPDASVSAVATAQGGDRDTRFNINTSDQDIAAVEAKLQELFPGKLKMHSMDIVSASAPSLEATSDDAQKGANSTSTATPKSTIAQLRFPSGMNQASLEAILQQARTEAGLPDMVVDLTSSDPDFVPGGSRPLENWTATVSLPSAQTETLLKAAQEDLAKTPVFPTANKIGGKVAGDTQVMAVYALVVSNLLIVLYVWVRFQNLVFGVAAVIALIHDVLVTVAALALSYWLAAPLGFLLVDPFKISLEVVAALLTIVGFSINDTIVIFDRIREIRGKSPDLNGPMINLALNQTLSRTILTSGTVLMVTIILYAWGGEGIHPFAFAMLIGVITGSYSSLYIAAPILLWHRGSAARSTARRVGANAVPA